MDKKLINQLVDNNASSKKEEDNRVLTLKVGNIATTDTTLPVSRTRGYLTRPRYVLTNPQQDNDTNTPKPEVK